MLGSIVVHSGAKMMKKRLEDLQKLKSYTEGIDKDLTMILQAFQWDRKTLLQNPPLLTCKYNSNHKVPPDKAEEHEKECFLGINGYSKDDQLLPDPLDLESSTLVKLRKEDIQQIITNASRSDPSFKKVYKKMIQRGEAPYLFYIGSGDAEPMSLERLQASYSADERRAIHDAVVSAAPSCHDLTDLALPSGGDEKNSKVILSRQEILLELRNMRRRRTKYRVAAKSRNYSDVLRDVIRTQMEHYNDGKNEETEPKDTMARDNSQGDTRNVRTPRPEAKDGKHRYDGKIVPQPIKIKIEREDSAERNYRDNNHREYNRNKFDRTHRYETAGSKDRRDRDVDRRDDRSKERRSEEFERSQRYGEHSRKRRLDDDIRERRYYYEESRDRRRDDEPDREYRSDKRSKKDPSHKDYQVKMEPGLDEDRHDFQEETSREKRHKDKRDKTHKHKDKKEKRRDRERSKERRDHRYEERSSEGIHIKREREDVEGKEKADRKHKSKSRRHDRSRRDDSFDSYCDGPSEEVYDPNKKIKKEK